MTVRVRERPAARIPPARQAGDDSGVSPVVGMILVLAISIVGIAAILYWGLPAIDEMKANVEYRSLQTQFGELDGTIRELVAGTTEKTAKRWQPSLNRGDVRIVNNSEPWLFALEKYNASYNSLAWHSFADGDAYFNITNRGSALGFVKVEAFLVTGTTALTPLNVTVDNSANDDQMGGTLSMTNNTAYGFKVWVKDAAAPGTAYQLDKGTFKIRVWSGSSLVAEAWYMNTTRIEYNLRAVTSKQIVYNNGALISIDNGNAVVSNSPPVPPVTNTSGVPRFFSRVVVINGTAAFAGENRFDVLVSLYSTVTLASYDCALKNASDCVYSAKIFVWGDQKPTWDDYLTRTGLGYNYAKLTDGNAGVYLERREAVMAYTLLGSNIRMVG